MPAPAVDAGLAVALAIAITVATSVAAERERVERLLLNVLPTRSPPWLKQREDVIADGFPDVTVLFADPVGFTHTASGPPRSLGLHLSETDATSPGPSLAVELEDGGRQKWTSSGESRRLVGVDVVLAVGSRPWSRLQRRCWHDRWALHLSTSAASKLT